MTIKVNGLITKIWGPFVWKTMHFMSFGYPDTVNITSEVKKTYRQFYESILKILPCIYCQESISLIIQQDGHAKLDDSVFESRDSLTRWVYHLHEAVNNKLEVKYDISYADLVTEYNTYRADCQNKQISVKGCDNVLDKKTLAYRADHIKKCPIIPRKTALHFIKYAHKRGLTAEDMKYVHDSVNENRDIDCEKIFDHMKLNGIKSIESEGPYKGMPTIDELKLILHLSSNLSVDKLNDIISTMCDCKYKKIYRIVKD